LNLNHSSLEEKRKARRDGHGIFDTNAIRYPMMCMPDAVYQEIVSVRHTLPVEIAGHHL